MSPRRVLVTGAAGYLGRALLAELRRRLPKAGVLAAGRRDADLACARQARRLVARARPELVFHLAGARPPAAPAALWAGNVSTTLNLGAALTRLLPHPYNFAPIAGIALFGGAQFSDKRLAFLVPLAAMSSLPRSLSNS